MDRTEDGAIRVLLVDDVPQVRQTIRSLLAFSRHFKVVGEASDGEEAVHTAQQLRPSVVVMDIHMPRRDGIWATARIKRTMPDVKVVGLSVFATDETRQMMLFAGATAVVSKEQAIEHLGREILESVKRRSNLTIGQ